MKKLFLLFLVAILVGCAGKKYRILNSQLNGALKCQQSWVYFKLSDTLKGVILSHINAGFLCGTMASASVSLIVTDTKDTLRVLELCNVGKRFNSGDKVTICYSEKPPFNVSIPINSFYDCRYYNTYYGNVNLQ